MSNLAMLAAIGDYIKPWQWLALVALLGVLAFWYFYRKKQM